MYDSARKHCEAKVRFTCAGTTMCGFSGRKCMRVKAVNMSSRGMMGLYRISEKAGGGDAEGLKPFVLLALVFFGASRTGPLS